MLGYGKYLPPLIFRVLLSPACKKMPTRCLTHLKRLAKYNFAKNRELVRDMVRLRGAEDRPTVIVAQSDTAYNNPIKGQRFYQPGSQCWAPCFPGEPGLDHIPSLYIAFSTRSKVCSCRNGDHKPGCCKRTFPVEKAMGIAEYQLGRDLGEQLVENDESALYVQTIVTDGDSTMHRGMMEIMATKGVDTDNCSMQYRAAHKRYGED